MAAVASADTEGRAKQNRARTGVPTNTDNFFFRGKVESSDGDMKISVAMVW
jgi:hypothetical protein